MDDELMSAGRRSGWKQWSESEAREALRAWEASHVSAKAFAADKGYSAQRLLNWKRRLAESPTPARSTEPFVAVELSDIAQQHTETITIEHGSVTVRLPGSYAPEAIARLVRALSPGTRC